MEDDKKTTEISRMTLIEEGTELKRSVSSSCPGLIRGRVAGDVAAPSLTVAPSGAVSGRVKVGTMVSTGEISGEIEADNASLSGRVNDETVIRARTLEVKLASEGRMTVTFGEARLEIGDAPGK